MREETSKKKRDLDRSFTASSTKLPTRLPTRAGREEELDSAFTAPIPSDTDKREPAISWIFIVKRMQCETQGGCEYS